MMVATTESPERQALRSRIRACWRVVFAVVGFLDCSCFCYCCYHHHDFLGYNSATAVNKKNRQSRPKTSKKEQKLQEVQHRAQTRNNKYVDYTSTIANAEAINASASTDSHVYQKQHGLSSVVWKSMAFHHHPVREENSTAVDDSNNHDHKEETPTPQKQKTYHAFLLVHLGFGMLCGIEMILRAKEARRVVLENKAIMAFEEHIAATVAKAYRKRLLLAETSRFSYDNLKHTVGKRMASISSQSFATGALKSSLYLPSLTSFYSSNFDSTETTVHTSNHQEELGTRSDKNTSDVDDDQNIEDNYQRDNEKNQGEGRDRENLDAGINDEAANKKSIILFLRSTFGLWLPVGGTCLFWLSLLPFQTYNRIIRIFLSKVLDYFWGNAHTNGTCSLGEFEFMEVNQYCYVEDSYYDGHDATATGYLNILGDDTAWATLWATNFVVQWTRTCEEIQEFMMTAWKRYIFGDKKRYLLGDIFQNQAHGKLHRILLDHKKLHAILFHRPKLIWFRVGRILNIVKLVRFAGPLARMMLKLQDQLFVSYATFWKARSSRSNRELRLQRPSIMLRDLRRLESIHKVETTIAAWPSRCSMLLETLSKETSQVLSPRMATTYAEEFLRKSRERGKQITKQIEWLQKQFKKGVTEFSPTEIHDRMLQLSKDLSKRNLFSVYDKKETGSHTDILPANSPRSRRRRTETKRWYDFLYLENLLSSRDHLISPRSRFSVVWRITVTNCLLVELTRLSVSWHLTQTFHLSISQVIGRLFVNCGTIEEGTKRKFRFFTNLIEDWHVGLSRAIPFVPFPKESLWVLCVPTSWFSKLLLLLGSMLETFIDVVSFLDIFFWFFTGDLDPTTGIVVPKAFFSRCILPGTLVQVIDHPTLPNVLPSLLAKLAAVSAELGWSRLVLWSCALVPALVHELFLPASAYFFRHLEESDNWHGGRGGDNNDILMTCAESFGYLPTRSSQTLERTMTRTSFWLRETPEVDTSATYSSNDDDDSDDEKDGVNRYDKNVGANHGLLRPTSYGLHRYREVSGILTPTGSPRRGILKEPSVRFENNASMTSSDDDDEGSSMADFDIGLSLSSHNLDGLNDAE